MDEASESEEAGVLIMLGLTVFGLLFANLAGFAHVWPAADILPLQTADPGPADRVVWWLGQTFTAWVFNILLLVLFGSALALGLDVGGRGSLGWMCLLGLMAAYLFWHGELLTVMALAGMIARPMRALQPATRWMTLGALIGGSFLILLAGAGITALLPDTMALADLLGLDNTRIAAIEASHQAGFLARLPGNMATALQFHMVEMFFLGGGVLGFVLLGMELVERGFWSGRWPVMPLVLSAAIALGIGLPLNGWAALHALSTDFAPSQTGQGVAAHATGAMLTAWGYAALVVLAVRFRLGEALQLLLIRAGHLWLSVVVGQIIVLTLIFSGLPGVALFGRIGPLGLFAMGIGLALVQAGLIWLCDRHLRVGPVEWALEGLAHRRFARLRR
ncbi:DUF418 domain-containing protein [Maricaulis maris]|uniref:Putative membrane protein YeiB n=1 Tax=Maricaulis maris TaxID=74318 RepID=A0A495DD00_9PROT|nr:DUF418 domain-containing protein [Maricaulis maris]RKR00207.1 putative membrane protein YeiB [Maricaulis maris]